MAKLTPEELEAGLARLPGWRREGEAIARTYAFRNFRVALGFVAFVGEVAEELGHHPDIDVRYDKVRLAVTTHDAGGLTGKDLELARRIDQRD
jgi:4a-hydroxytetrahydrobiopterin dehydratase